MSIHVINSYTKISSKIIYLIKICIISILSFIILYLNIQLCIFISTNKINYNTLIILVIY